MTINGFYCYICNSKWEKIPAKLNRERMKRLFVIYIGLFLSLCLSQAQTMEQYMAHMMPSSTQLKQDQVAQLLAKGELGYLPGSVVNLYGDTSRLLAYEKDNYALIQLSDQGYVSVKKWVLDNATEMCGFSSWVCGDMCDGWWRLQTLKGDAFYFPTITLSDFFDQDSLAADGISADSLSGKFEMVFMHCEFGRSDSVHIYCDTERYLEAERRKEYAKYFKGNRVTLLPKGDRFSIVAVGRDEHLYMKLESKKNSKKQ